MILLEEIENKLSSSVVLLERNPQKIVKLSNGTDEIVFGITLGSDDEVKLSDLIVHNGATFSCFYISDKFVVLDNRMNLLLLMKIPDYYSATFVLNDRITLVTDHCIISINTFDFRIAGSYSFPDYLDSETIEFTDTKIKIKSFEGRTYEMYR